MEKVNIPYYYGFPMVVAISGKLLNDQLAHLASRGLLPTTWSEHPPKESKIAWQVDATLGAPYIDFPEEAERGARLNFPILSGTVSTWYVDRNDHQAREQKQDLAGNVLGIFTPMSLVPPENYNDADLSIRNLYLELDSPHVNTVVRTSSDVPTMVMDGSTTEEFAARFQQYVQSMHPGRMVIGRHVARTDKAPRLSGCLEPDSCKYSITPVVDERFPHQDPRRTEMSTINWLLSTPGAQPAGNNRNAGEFPHSPLPAGEYGVFIISFYSLVNCVLLDPLAASVSASPNDFDYDGHKSFSLLGFRGPGSDGTIDIVITPAEGGRIQARFTKKVTIDIDDKFLGIKIGSESSTTTGTWSTFFTVTFEDENLAFHVETTEVSSSSSSSSSGLGFLGPIGMGVVSIAIGRNPEFSSALSGAVGINVARLRILGDRQFHPRSARIIDGDLVLGLELPLYEWVEPNTAESYWLNPAEGGNDLEEARKWAKWTAENASWTTTSGSSEGGSIDLRSQAVLNGATHLTVRNETSTRIQFRWINGQGVPTLLEGQDQFLEAGAAYSANCSVGDIWGVYDSTGRLGVFFRLIGKPPDNGFTNVVLKPFLKFRPGAPLPIRPPLGPMIPVKFTNTGTREFKVSLLLAPDPWTMNVIPVEWMMGEPDWRVPPGGELAAEAFWGAVMVVTTDDKAVVGYYQIVFPAPNITIRLV